MIKQYPIPWMIWWAIALHIVWGVLLLTDSNTARLAILVGLNRLIDLGISDTIVAIIIITAALIATFGLLTEGKMPWRWSLCFLMPQYAVVMQALLSALYSVYEGEVMDRQIDRDILVAVLAAIILGAVFHSASILERYWRRWI